MDCPPALKELLKTLYNLPGPAVELLHFLCRNEARVEEMAAELGRNRSTVQRYVSMLQAADLISRRGVIADDGHGRYYVYTVSDRDVLQTRIRERLKTWESDHLETLDAL